jgi:hypothetical protein
MQQEPAQPPHHDLRYDITDAEAEEFLRRLADPNDELRRKLEESPRDCLLEWNLDIVGIPEKVTLPDAGEIDEFINNHLHRSGSKTNNVGYAILYFMLGAMPLVVADGDAAP